MVRFNTCPVLSVFQTSELFVKRSCFGEAGSNVALLFELLFSHPG